MIFCTKKYLSALLLILLLGACLKINAQAPIGPPEITCVAVDSVGDVTLTWVCPSFPINDHSFLSYKSFNSTLYSGPYSAGAQAFLPQTNTNCTTNGTTADNNPVYFYVQTDTANATSVSSDTVKSIFLSVNNSGGYAQLSWNSIHYPFIKSSNGIYRIYREYPTYVWTLVGTVKDTNTVMTYNDTIYFCNPVTLNYKVEIDDTLANCTSVSNRAQATNLKEVFPPPITILDTLSVNPNNSIDLTWSRSIHNNVVGYIIYEYFVVNHVGKYLPIDTVWGIDSTSRLGFTKGPNPSDPFIGNPSDSGLSFEVASLDSCEIQPGVLSSSQNTLFLQEFPDLCNHSNTLKWNGYVNLVDTVGGYQLFVSVNGGPYSLLATTNKNTYSYIDSNLNIIENRCYYIRMFDKLHRDTTASSNIVCYTVGVPKKPAFNYLGAASVVFNSGEASIFGYVDKNSGAGFYEFQRSNDSLNHYSTIATQTATHTTDTITYVDNSVNASQQSYWYRIVTLDSCNQGMDTTNIGRTVYLTAVGEPTGVNLLQWNDYQDWNANVNFYQIYRSQDAQTWTLINTYYYAPANGGTNSYEDNIRNITTGEGTFYYYIKACERLSIYPFIDTSFSNIAEAYQDPIVFIPDAFNPKGVNRIFKPVGVFIDVTNYDFVIINRWGVKVFESSDPNIGWDGTYNGSKKPEQEDVYVYLLTYTSSKGQYFERKGTVTLLK